MSVWLKGLYAGLEIAGGVALLAVSPGFIIRVVALLTQDELAEDPRDLIANYLLKAATHLSASSKQFMAFYLLAHGVTKILLVGALLRHKLWAYPIAVIAFGAFILYQLYRFTFTHSMGLIALSLFDLVVIWLIWLEYRALSLGVSRTLIENISPAHVEQVFDIIRTINRQGVTIFMVEQNANMALSIADRAYVLQTGQVVLSGKAADLRENELIRHAYLGELRLQ